jgi:hypothetical protein
MPFEHLFNERQADLKNAGRFRNGQATFFDCRHYTNA